jgi:Na+-driven multidrug efflux pump
MRIYFSGMIFNMVYNFSASIMRASGETKLPLYFLSFAGVLNVVLNIFFVTVLNMNVAGVALATTISQAISAILAIIALTRRTDDCRLIFKQMRIYKKQLLAVLRFGLPAGINSSLFALSNVIITSSINSFNNPALLSGNGACANIEGFLSSITSGFQTTQINFIGQNSGARNYKRVKKIYFTALCTMIFTIATASSLIFLFRRPLLSLYITDSPEAIEWGIKRMLYIPYFYYLIGCMDDTTCALRGLGLSLTPMFIALIGACGFRILWIYTIFQIPRFHTMEWLFVSYIISWTVTLIAQAIVYKKKYNKNTRAIH